MNAVKTIIIHGQSIEVCFCDPGDWRPHGLGVSNSKMGRIKISSDIPSDAQAATLLHEVLHQISDMNGLDIEEVQVCVLANALFGFLRDNHWAADWICRGLPIEVPRNILFEEIKTP